MKKILLLFVCLATLNTISAQCYNMLREKGIALYNAGDCATALIKFNAATNCPDKPAKNDLATWIAKSKKCAEPQKTEKKEPTPKKETPTKKLTSWNYETIYVEGGTFQMGGDMYDSEKPIHSVTLSSFQIGKYEVTQAQWYFIMGKNPSDHKNCDNCPVESVSWDDIQIFIQKLNAKTSKTYRLPTEAEWEFAARGGNKSQGYTYSGSNDVGIVAQYEGNNNKSTKPVGSKKANELGIYDMSGNVWEWCQDWYKSYDGSTKPFDYTNSNRILRGGSWNFNAYNCRCAFRNFNYPSGSNDYYGFRLVFIP